MIRDGPLARRVIAPTVAQDAEIWRGSALLHDYLVGLVIRMSRATVARKRVPRAKALFGRGWDSGLKPTSPPECFSAGRASLPDAGTLFAEFGCGWEGSAQG